MKLNEKLEKFLIIAIPVAGIVLHVAKYVIIGIFVLYIIKAAVK